MMRGMAFDVKQIPMNLEPIHPLWSRYELDQEYRESMMKSGKEAQLVVSMPCIYCGGLSVLYFQNLTRSTIRTNEGRFRVHDQMQNRCMALYLSI